MPVRLAVKFVKAVNRRHRYRWTTLNEYQAMEGDVTLAEADWLTKIAQQAAAAESKVN